MSMRDAVACFGASSEHWESLRRLDDFHVGMVPTDFNFSEREGALRRLESYGQGSQYLLGWVASTKTEDFQRSGAEAIATRGDVPLRGGVSRHRAGSASVIMPR